MPGLVGHDRGAKVVAAALRDAGMEVIYTGLHQTPEQIVEAAVQEDVDVVALSVLSGAHMTLFPEIHELMRARGIGDRLLTGGGIIPNEDMSTLLARGVGRLFGPGTNTQDIVGYIREWYLGVHGADALPPLPPPAARPEPLMTSGVSPKPAGPRKAAAKPQAKPAAKSPAKRVAKAPAKRSATKSASRNGRSARPKAKPVKKRTAKSPARKGARRPPRASGARRRG